MRLGPALLFCPADRPDRYAKAAERADTVILDLEDAVAPADKPAAREALVATPLDPERTIVRVNAASSGELVADLAALVQTSYRTVMLAKTESVAELDAVAEYAVVALCETAAGILAAEQLAAHSSVVALMWGAEDLVVSLGGSSSRVPDGSYRDVARHARSRVLLAAAASGRTAIDAPHLQLDDEDGLRAEASDAAAVGFAGTACLHPRQVEVVRAAYRPDAGSVNWARRLLDAARHHGGVFTFDGAMIDEPVLARARRILYRS